MMAQVSFPSRRGEQWLSKKSRVWEEVGMEEVGSIGFQAGHKKTSSSVSKPLA
jgi:hypothetical protein